VKRKVYIAIAVIATFPGLASIELTAQTDNSCRIGYQYWFGDPLIPGATCTTVGPFLAVCTVASNHCTAICWECLNGGASAAQPINLANGNTFITQVDITVPGLGGGLTLSRTWNSSWPYGEALSNGIFGGYWRSTYEENISVDGDGLAKYSRGTGGIWTLGLVSPQWPLTYDLIAPVSGNTSLSYDGAYWTLAFKNGEKRIFDGPTGHLLSISDRNGNTTQLMYDSANRLTTVTDAAARHLYFAYANQSSNLVTGVSSDAGLAVGYTYDAQGRLTTVTKPDLTTVSFQYDSGGLILAVLDSDGKVLESHTYDAQRRGLTSSRAGGVDAVTISYPALYLP